MPAGPMVCEVQLAASGSQQLRLSVLCLFPPPKKGGVGWTPKAVSKKDEDDGGDPGEGLEDSMGRQVLSSLTEQRGQLCFPRGRRGARPLLQQLAPGHGPSRRRPHLPPSLYSAV